MAKHTRDPALPAEAEEKMDATLRKAAKLALRARRLDIRRHALTAKPAQQVDELNQVYGERAEKLRARRERIVREVAALWAKHLRKRKNVRLPSGLAIRQEYVEIEVRDMREVVDALDRLDRLDLVREVIDTRGLARLYKQGKLESLPPDAIHAKTTERFLVRHTKKDNCSRTYDCELQCLDGGDSGSGKGPKAAA